MEIAAEARLNAGINKCRITIEYYVITINLLLKCYNHRFIIKTILFLDMVKVQGIGASDPGSIPWSDSFNVI